MAAQTKLGSVANFLNQISIMENPILLFNELSLKIFLFKYHL